MLAPPRRSVTLFVSHSTFPVAASRQTNLPEDFAENTQLLCSKGVEVLLKTLRAGDRASGQLTEAAGLWSSRFNIRPPNRRRPAENAGVEMMESDRVGSGSRQYNLPVWG